VRASQKIDTEQSGSRRVPDSQKSCRNLAMACLAVFRADKHHDEELYSEHRGGEPMVSMEKHAVTSPREEVALVLLSVQRRLRADGR
jgi:hypothetical protein